MNTLIKFFPFIPAEKDGGKLVLALLFYLVIVPIINLIVGFILGLTVILIPLAFFTGFFFGIYGLVGTVLAIVGYLGKLQ